MTVTHREQTGTDAHGAPVFADVVETVDHVSVRPETTMTLIDGKAHEYRIETTLAMAFPDTYTGDLRGARIEVPCYPGRVWLVQGDPLPTPDAPTAWNRNVRAVLADG